MSARLGARASFEKGTLVPVLAEGRQTVAFCGPNRPTASRRRFPCLWTTVEIVDKLCKDFRIGFPAELFLAELVKQHLFRPIGVLPGS